MTQLLFVCLWCLSSCYPSAIAQNVCLQANESVCWPFKRMSRFLVAFGLTRKDGILADFDSQIFLGAFFPSTGALGWGAWCGVGTLRSSKRTSAAEMSLPVLNGYTYRANSFYISSQSVCGFFFVFLVIGFLSSSSSDGSPDRLSYNLVLICCDHEMR